MTDREGQTKRQHYVPRFILRRFSDDERNVAIMLMKYGRYVPSGPLRNQCYEDYFYGKDQILEQGFARQETKVASMLGDLAKERLEELSEEALLQLRLFVHYQLLRTKAAVEQTTEAMSSFAREAAATTATLNGDRVEEEQMASLRLERPEAVAEQIWIAARSVPVFRDLDVKFLVSERTVGFVIGDHPVVACNQFAEHHPVLSRWPNSTAAVSKDLQLFLPLSSSVTLCLYDAGTYDFDVGRRVCNVGPRDVRFLNSAQAVNALQCIFLNERLSDEKSRQMLRDARANHKDVHVPIVYGSEPLEKPDGNFQQLVAIAKPDVRVGARYSFLRVSETASYEHYDAATIPARSEELIEFSKYYAQTLERAFQEARRQGEELTEQKFRDLVLDIAKQPPTGGRAEPPHDVPGGIVLKKRGVAP